MEDCNLSHNDVPGLKDDSGKSKHNDELAMGCWAEHEDGSLILVEGTEDGRVVYSVFDLSDEIVEYRDAMSELGFKKAFSWTEDDKIIDSPWTWHDKTPFPWDTVIASGSRQGGRPASADHLMSAAEKVARSRDMHRRAFDYDSALMRAGATGRKIVDKVQRALGELRR